MAPSSLQQFGRRVRQLRREREWDIERLAQRLRWTVEVVTEIEAGRADPTLDELERLAKALGVEMADLFVFPKRSPRHHLREQIRKDPKSVLAAVRKTGQTGPETPRSPRKRRPRP